MRHLPACLAALTFALSSLTSMGCAAPPATDDAGDESEGAARAAGDTEALHEPAGAESKAILDALRAPITQAVHGQKVLFNYRDPKGEFLAHGNWAYFAGLIEGPDGNRTPIDYENSDYKQAMEAGAFDGVQRNGHFAASVVALMRKNADGAWSVAESEWEGKKYPSFAVGPTDVAWMGWLETPPARAMDIVPAHPASKAESKAILDGLRGPIEQDLHGQKVFFNYTDPAGTLVTHRGWAFLSGILEGPNGNRTPIDYSNSAYKAAQEAGVLDGVERNGNFAASIVALVRADADGKWAPASQTFDGQPSSTYAVGPTDVAWMGWMETPPVEARDVFPYTGK